MANNSPPLSLRLGLVTYQPSKCHHAQYLLGPSFHNPCHETLGEYELWGVMDLY